VLDARLPEVKEERRAVLRSKLIYTPGVYRLHQVVVDFVFRVLAVRTLGQSQPNNITESIHRILA
jgi:hypothetical protein